MGALRSLWRDESGFIISAELVLIATVLIIGLLIGLATVRDDLVSELADVGDSISEMIQSYSFSGRTAHSSSTSGSLFTDLADFGETGVNSTDQNAGSFPSGIQTVGGVSE